MVSPRGALPTSPHTGVNKVQCTLQWPSDPKQIPHSRGGVETPQSQLNNY